jgi:L-cysteine desulfidase
MLFSEYLDQEWMPALGCTEPASIAYAAANAQKQCEGEIVHIKLIVDPKMYKNCYAVGIPNTGHKTGILWAVAIGAYLPDASLGLEIFKSANDEIISKAQKLIEGKKIEVGVDQSQKHLGVDCTIEKIKGTGRVLISREHTNIIKIEKDRQSVFEKNSDISCPKVAVREKIAAMSLNEMIEMSRKIEPEDRERLRLGVEMNEKIARHGLKLFPRKFIELTSNDELTRIATLVCAGVYARMWGEEFTVMSLAGSGNKGILVSVPLALRAEHLALSDEKAGEALALAALITSATTYYLGTLSAVCGCSNAAGIGLAAGLISLEGGGEKEISLVINNMVGNLSGMICDGAKIGCALKTMTSVDAAFRSAALAMCGIGIPTSDGIVAKTGIDSLKNLGRLASPGMISTEKEILAIMQEKLGDILQPGKL